MSDYRLHSHSHSRALSRVPARREQPQSWRELRQPALPRPAADRRSREAARSGRSQPAGARNDQSGARDGASGLPGARPGRARAAGVAGWPWARWSGAPGASAERGARARSARPGAGAARAAGLSVRALRRIAFVLLIAVLAEVLAIVALRIARDVGSTRAAAGAATGVPAAASAVRSAGAPAVESGLLPWGLAAPLSRAVLVADARGALVIFGGLTASGAFSRGIWTIDPSTGRLSPVGELAAPLHDAAGALLSGSVYLFGGGAGASVADVEAVGGGARASVVGALPRARSDAAAVTLGDSAYVVGGYDGARLDPAVLATRDGRSFARAALLPIPVRYPAVAALGGKLYVFGGEGAPGAVDAIQEIDPVRHSARVIGHMPLALFGASAETVGGELIVAGGATTAAAAAGALGEPGAPTAIGASGAPRTAAAAAAAEGAPEAASAAVWVFDAAHARLLRAGALREPVAFAAATAQGGRIWLVGGENAGHPVSAIQTITPNAAFGSAGAIGAGSPYFGAKLLIADRGHNRLVVLDDAERLVWSYPNAGSPPPPGGFYFPDDAFFIRHGSAIISNQEENHTVVEIAYPSGSLLWSYGHPGQPGNGAGYLRDPDDAYLLRDGRVAIADAYNCRVLILNHDGSIATQIGTNGACFHEPPRALGAPNGDTPLANGDLLVSEIKGSWISEYTEAGKLVWDARLPIAYPSDPQQIGPDRYLVADYTRPGAIVEFDRAGKILYEYRPTSGPAMLDHPSLVELLPSGVFMVNDDYNDRMVAIDPSNGAIVWEYGTARGGSKNALAKPDGFDLLMPDGSTPTHV